MSLNVARCPACLFSVPVFEWAGVYRYVPHRESVEGQPWPCRKSFDTLRRPTLVRRVAGAADYTDLRLSEAVAVPFLQDEREAQS